MNFLKYVGWVMITVVLIIVLALSLFRGAAALRETESAQALSPSNGQYVQTSFGKIHVSVWGDAKGQPVLFTHGMAAWGGLWTQTAEKLAQNGYHVFAIDQPPFGFSDREQTDYSVTAQSMRVNEVITGLGLGQVLLVGHSYGGGIALETSLRFPQQIKAMVLVCPVTGLAMAGKESETKLPRDLPLPLRSSFVTEILVSATVTNPALSKYVLRRFMFQKDKITDAQLEILRMPARRAGNTHYFALWLQQFLAGDPRALSSRREEVSLLKVPTALIWGEKDDVAPIGQGEDFARLVALKGFARLPNVGHMPQLEEPEEFTRELLLALEKIK